MLKGDDRDFDKICFGGSQTDAGKVAADAHWTWSTLTEARRACLDIDELGLNFLEDPFAASDIRLTHRIRNELITPIAAGEDVFGAGVVADLVSGIDILRVDATTVGGITGADRSHQSRRGGRQDRIPARLRATHVHLACAFPNVEAVEWITQESGADPLDQFLQNIPSVKHGQMSPSEEPGIGISIDWEAVEKLSRRNA